jgi:hypothetical protein
MDHICDLFVASVQTTRRPFQNTGTLNYRETQSFAPILEWSPELTNQKR